MNQVAPPPLPILSQSEAKNPRINQLSAHWQQVWLLALERQRKLNDALDRLEEVRILFRTWAGQPWTWGGQEMEPKLKVGADLSFRYTSTAGAHPSPPPAAATWPFLPSPFPSRLLTYAGSH